MLRKVWNILKLIGRWARNTLFVLFCFWTVITLSAVQQDISLLQLQNRQSYDVQASVFSKTVEAISILAKYTLQLEANTLERDSTLAKYLQDLDKKIEDAQAAVKAADEASMNRDKIIANYVQVGEQKPAYEYMKSMTVYLVEAHGDSSLVSVGTGTVLKVDAVTNEMFLITNKHVCDWAEGSVCFVYQDKVKYPITLVKQNDVDHDMQIVKTSKLIPGKQAVKGIKDVKAQDKVFCVGNNHGNPFMYSEGTVSGYMRGTGDMLVGMPSGPGNSGSGIFTVDGYLSGLLYAGQVFEMEEGGATLDTSHAICINSEVLRLFTAEYFN